MIRQSGPGGENLERPVFPPFALLVCGLGGRLGRQAVPDGGVDQGPTQYKLSGSTGVPWTITR